MAGRSARNLALSCTFAVLACSLTIDEDELGGEPTPVCSSKQKACNVEGVVECVSLTDPSYGCARPSCIPCNLPKATATCSPSTGECAVGACVGSWSDCDLKTSNGCEVNTSHDVDNCGRCHDTCPAKPNAEVACGSTNCYIRVCKRGFKDCNEDFDDGCEVDTMRDARHCGECNRSCEGVCTLGACEQNSE